MNYYIETTVIIVTTENVTIANKMADLSIKMPDNLIDDWLMRDNLVDDWLMSDNLVNDWFILKNFHRHVIP